MNIYIAFTESIILIDVNLLMLKSGLVISYNKCMITFCLCLWMYVHIIIIPLYSIFGGCPLSSDDFQSWISSVLLYTFMWSLERIFYWRFHPSPVPTFEVHCLVCYFFFIFVSGVVRHLWAFLRVQIHVSLSSLYTRVCLHLLGRCFQSSLLSAMSFGWCLWFVFLPLCMLFTLDHCSWWLVYLHLILCLSYFLSFGHSLLSFLCDFVSAFLSFFSVSVGLRCIFCHFIWFFVCFVLFFISRFAGWFEYLASHISMLLTLSAFHFSFSLLYHIRGFLICGHGDYAFGSVFLVLFSWPHLSLLVIFQLCGKYILMDIITVFCLGLFFLLILRWSHFSASICLLWPWRPCDVNVMC